MVEILIVIFVFWVWILGVLSVLTNSLAYFDNISTKTKASFLAKEGLEIAYNFRDSRIEEWLPWNYFTGSCPHELYLWSWESLSTFKIWFSTWSNPYWIFETGPHYADNDFTSYFNSYFLEIYTWETAGNGSWLGYFVYNPRWEHEELPAKGFARYVEFTPILLNPNAESSAALDVNKIVKISSHALYKRGSLTWEIVLESFIGMKDTIPADPTCIN